MKRQNVKKIKSVLSWAIIVCALLVVLFTAVSVISSSSNMSVFGYKFFVVMSDSMSETHFDAGDVIISKKVDPTTLDVGDVVTFVSPNGSGQVVTHMIRAHTVTLGGEPAFVTYGTTTGVSDEQPVPHRNVLGKYQTKISGLGWVLQFLKSRAGYVIFIMLPLLIMAVSWGYTIVSLYKKYRSECRQEYINECRAKQQMSERNQEFMSEIESVRALLDECESEYTENQKDA